MDNERAHELATKISGDPKRASGLYLRGRFFTGTPFRLAGLGAHSATNAEARNDSTEPAGGLAVRGREKRLRGSWGLAMGAMSL
jgi:hypothetical protein